MKVEKIGNFQKGALKMISEKEFAEIVEKTKRTVLSSITKNLSQQYYHCIDDIVQETYIRAYRSLVKNKFKNQSSLNTWLFAIAKNETIRMYDKMQREEAKREKIKLSFKKDLQKESNKIIDNIYFEKLIEKLPVKQRKVFSLLYQGFKESEVSKKLGIPRGTVKSRISRGREYLQRLMKEEANG